MCHRNRLRWGLGTGSAGANWGKNPACLRGTSLWFDLFLVKEKHRVSVVNWNSTLLPFPKFIPSPYIQQRMVQVCQGRLVPAPKNPCFRVHLKLAGERCTFWWLRRGSCGCEGSGSWGQTSMQDRPSQECSNCA